MRKVHFFFNLINALYGHKRLKMKDLCMLCGMRFPRQAWEFKTS